MTCMNHGRTSCRGSVRRSFAFSFAFFISCHIILKTFYCWTCPYSLLDVSYLCFAISSLQPSAALGSLPSWVDDYIECILTCFSPVFLLLFITCSIAFHLLFAISIFETHSDTFFAYDVLYRTIYNSLSSIIG